MSGLFKTPEPIKMPVVEEEPPEIVSESIKGEAAKPRRKKGYAETIITGELEPITTGQILLG